MFLYVLVEDIKNRLKLFNNTHNMPMIVPLKMVNIRIKNMSVVE